MTFSKKILKWYHENKRDLPWRQTRDPYKIWLSEIMLQQTRVAQGMPYYHRFLSAFPTVGHLAGASEEQVLKLWQGLGYYSRARNLHATAKMVVERRNGEFPNTYQGLRELKGVGDYTASAVASICFDIPTPVVDGNVYRVLSRHFGVDVPINGPQGAKYFKELARQVMDHKNIRDYNQGIMEFGAIQCAPKKPYCLLCPLNSSCVALKENRVDSLPVKLVKTKIKQRFFNYLVLLDPQKKTVMEQRKGKGIWQKLYQFPLLEAATILDETGIWKQLGQVERFGEVHNISLFNKEPVLHKLSHQHLHTQFWIVELLQPIEKGISWQDIVKYPVPVLIADFIKTFKI